MSRTSAVAHAAALCFVASVAMAQPAPADRADEAVTIFERGADAFRQGRFEEALRLFQEAYAIKAEPVLLYNMARAYEGLGDSARALDAYERYLRSAPDADDRGAVEARVAALRKEIARAAELEQARRRPRQTPAPKPAPRAQARPVSPVPWVIAGIGALGLVNGAVFGGLTVAREQQGNAADDAVRAAELRDEGKTFALVANVSFIAGGAVALAGVTWGVVDLLSSDATSEELALVVSTGSLCLRARF